jgi:ribose 5-phosphate isomerase A
VAAATEHMVVVVGPEKVVGTLGTTFDLPVEVVPFARAAVERGIRALGGAPKLREAGDAAYLTDNGNQILDVHFESGISDAAQLELALDAIPGVVESGLFINLARTLVIGHDDGSADLRKKGA